MTHPNVERIVASLPKHCEIIDMLCFVSSAHVGLRHGWLSLSPALRSVSLSDTEVSRPTLLDNSGTESASSSEEIGGDPSKVSVLTFASQEIWAVISEVDSSLVDSWISNSESTWNGLQVRLSCDAGWLITSNSFASFKNPQGSCGSFSPGACHADAVSTVEQVCLLFLLLIFYQNKQIVTKKRS